MIPSSWRGYYSLAFFYHSPKSMNKAEFACNSVKYKCDKSKILMQSWMQRFYIKSYMKYLGIIVLRIKFWKGEVFRPNSETKYSTSYEQAINPMIGLSIDHKFHSK